MFLLQLKSVLKRIKKASERKIFHDVKPCEFFVLTIFGLIVTGCASIHPLSNETVGKYALSANPGAFKNFQYYVSRDIVLTYVSSATKTTCVGQVLINRDFIQLLSSTPGVVLEVRQTRNGRTMLGVAFEARDDALLWFIQNPAQGDSFFYLAYTNPDSLEIDYGGYLYTVDYKQAACFGATVQRLSPFRKVKKGKYDNMDPFLLYEGHL